MMGMETQVKTADDYNELSMPETQPSPHDAFEAALPSEERLQKIVLAGLTASTGIEVMPVKRSHRRLWLVSDKDGPGYARQKAYGMFRADWEMAEVLREGGKRADEVRARIDRDLCALAVSLAQRIRERVSTFRAYNNLGNELVTVRSSGMLCRYLKPHGADRIAVQDVVTDSLLVRVAAYFVVCPPGEEHIPQDGES